MIKISQLFKRKDRKTFPNTQDRCFHYSYITSYTTDDRDLCKTGKVLIGDGQYELTFYSSARDGVGVKLKCNQPYRILFDYNDGQYLLNDVRDYDYTDLLCKLNALNESAHDYRKAYSGLETITDSFVIDYFNDIL